MTARSRSAFLCLLAVTACSSVTRPSTKSSTSSPSPTVAESFFDARNVTATVEYLAGTIGPREATSHGYKLAATFVESQFRSFGYRVQRQTFHVLGGLSNYAPVQEGDTFNLIASPRGFDPTKPHIVVGAHLDTVPQAPGAVDNAAGVGIVLELARLASLRPQKFQVVFIAFGAEEARVPNGGLHGSRAYVSALSAAERRAITGAVVIDRLGTGTRVPICTASDRGRSFAQRLTDAARRGRVPFVTCTNATSDHVPFDDARIAAVRLGPDDFPEYHTPRDVSAVFVPAQAGRAGTVLWEALIGSA